MSVFAKDFPHYIEHMTDHPLFERATHSFLIRDPAKGVPSILKNAPEYTLKEFGMLEQRAWFDRLTERLGTPPPVIDSTICSRIRRGSCTLGATPSASRSSRGAELGGPGRATR